MNIFDEILINKIKNRLELCQKHVFTNYDGKEFESITLKDIHIILEELLNTPDRIVTSNEIRNNILESYTCYLIGLDDKIRERYVTSYEEAVRIVNDHFNIFDFSNTKLRDFNIVNIGEEKLVSSFTSESGQQGFIKKNKSF